MIDEYLPEVEGDRRSCPSQVLLSHLFANDSRETALIDVGAAAGDDQCGVDADRGEGCQPEIVGAVQHDADRRREIHEPC